MTLLDPRDVRALQVAATADQWTELRRGEFAVPSSDHRRTYRVSEYSCSCADHLQCGNRCKHMRGLSIYLALREAVTPAPKPVEAPFPVAVREGDETVFLSRREARRRGIATEHDPRLCGQCTEAEETQPTPSYRLEGEALWARFKGD